MMVALQHIVAMHKGKEGFMLTAAPKKDLINEPKIGSYAAMQPVSGVARVEESTVVHGIGRGGFVREDKPSKQ
jgi:hypothetical protein